MGGGVGAGAMCPAAAAAGVSAAGSLAGTLQQGPWSVYGAWVFGVPIVRPPPPPPPPPQQQRTPVALDVQLVRVTVQAASAHDTCVHSVHWLAFFSTPRHFQSRKPWAVRAGAVHGAVWRPGFRGAAQRRGPAPPGPAALRVRVSCGAAPGRPPARHGRRRGAWCAPDPIRACAGVQTLLTVCCGSPASRCMPHSGSLCFRAAPVIMGLATHAFSCPRH